MGDIYESCGFDGPEDAARLEAELDAEFPELAKHYDLAVTRLLRRLRKQRLAAADTEHVEAAPAGSIERFQS